MDSTQALNTISSVSGAYIRQESIKDIEGRKTIVYDPVIPQAVYR